MDQTVMAKNNLYKLCIKQLSWSVLLCLIWEESRVIFQYCEESNIHFMNHFCFTFQCYPRVNVSKICHPPPPWSYKKAAQESQFSQKFLLLIQSFLLYMSKTIQQLCIVIKARNTEIKEKFHQPSPGQRPPKRSSSLVWEIWKLSKNVPVGL